MPKLQALWEKERARGLVVLGVHVLGGNDKMEAFVKEKGITYPCVADAAGSVQVAYGVKSIPFLVLIDRAGKVRKIGGTGLEDDVSALLEETH